MLKIVFCYPFKSCFSPFPVILFTLLSTYVLRHHVTALTGVPLAVSVSVRVADSGGSRYVKCMFYITLEIIMLRYLQQ